MLGGIRVAGILSSSGCVLVLLSGNGRTQEIRHVERIFVRFHGKFERIPDSCGIRLFKKVNLTFQHFLLHLQCIFALNQICQELLVVGCFGAGKLEVVFLLELGQRFLSSFQLPRDVLLFTAQIGQRLVRGFQHLLPT